MKNTKTKTMKKPVKLKTEAVAKVPASDMQPRDGGMVDCCAAPTPYREHDSDRVSAAKRVDGAKCDLEWNSKEIERWQEHVRSLIEDRTVILLRVQNAKENLERLCV